MSELKPCPQEVEALDILEAMLDVCDLDNPGPMFAGQHVRGGICKIMDDDATKLRHYIEHRRAQPANEPLTHCGECMKYQTPDCAAKHAQALTDFCSHGVRKPEGSENDGTE